VRPGYLPDPVVPALLRHASAVAYPSLAEGFGLPVLEAMACGAPVITTTGTPMSALAGQAAVLVGPGDVEGLAEALTEVVRGADPERRQRGLEVAAAYTWEASAEGHMAAYRAALG
jgi:glycosyltransferase involved in cell wall biosynthesis